MQSKNIKQEVVFLRATKRFLIEELKHLKRKVAYSKFRIRNIDNHLLLNNEESAKATELKEFLYKEIAETKENITKNIQEIENTEKQKLRMYAELKKINNYRSLNNGR